MKRSRLAEMTWPEVEQAVSGGSTTLILPLGATEQHGPHLPLGTDTFRAEAMAEWLAKELPGALVAPPLPIGCSDEHAGFSGLLSLDHATLASVIVDCARRMSAWGVRRLVLLSAHGGNAQALGIAATRLGDELPQMQVLVPDSPNAVSDALLALAQADDVPAEAVGLHAGEGETSEMLYLHPELVRTECAVPGYTGSMTDLLPRLREAGLRPLTPNGVLGDPSRADAARGQRYLVQQVKQHQRWLTEP